MGRRWSCKRGQMPEKGGRTDEGLVADGRRLAEWPARGLVFATECMAVTMEGKHRMGK